MLRSMFTAISALRNHQLKLDTISNNIANISTIGFKKSRVNFQDILNQTLSGAGTSTTGGIGGVNPMQIGLGMTLGSIDMLFTQGNPQVTGNSTDMAIQGNGMFVLSDGVNTRYTRAGNFSLDSTGKLVNPANGWIIQGWQADDLGNININAPLSNISVPVNSIIPAKQTGKVYFTGNLEAGGDDAYATKVNVYDSLGRAHTLNFNLKPIGQSGKWRLDSVTETDDSIDKIDIPPNVELGFDNSGKLLADVTANIEITYSNDYPPKQTFSARWNKGDVTSYDQISDVKLKSQDGYASGKLGSYNIGSDGIVSGVYSNSLRRNISQIALAHFVNYGGLQREGENMFSPSNDSGPVLTGLANTEGRGSISAGRLEMSNVDLSEEFVNMITAQRGFQANSRAITVSDEVLQDLLNLKR